MAEESGVADVVVIPKFDMQCHESKMTGKDVKNLVRKYNIPLDLHPCPPTEGWTMDKLPDDNIGLGIVSTVSLFLVFYKISKQGHWFSFEKRVGKYAGVVTMSEYLCFPFLSGAFIMKGAAVPANHPVGQNTTPPLSVDQPIPDKTDSQQEVEVKYPKVITAREKKKAQIAKAAAKKKESKKRGNEKGGSSKAKKKRGSEGTKSALVGSGHVSSPVPLLTVAPVSQVISLQSKDDDGEPCAPNDERCLASHSPHGSVNEYVHHFANVEENKGVEVYKGVEESPPRVETFINMFGIPIHPAKEQVFVSETHADESSHPEHQNIEEGESSRGASVYDPQWVIPLRCRVDTPEWCRELMVHLSPSAAQKESNALTNEVALQRA
ncbi:hypothetical protein Tco_0586562 [Tanacetum coccineum]